MAVLDKVFQTILPLFDSGYGKKMAKKPRKKKRTDTVEKKVEVPWRDTTVEVTYKKIKNLSIRIVPPQGLIRISAPYWLSPKKVEQFIEERSQWIEIHRSQFQTLISISEYQYLSGETHYFLGNPYILKVLEEERNQTHVSLNENQLLLKVPRSKTKNQLNRTQREKELENWYRKHLYKEAFTYVKQYQVMLGVQVQTLRIKKMKTRWGTCNPTDKRVWLNLELIYRSSKCLEYVVLHELCHLIEASHNHKFKTLLNTYMPKWKEYERELDSLPIGCVPL